MKHPRKKLILSVLAMLLLLAVLAAAYIFFGFITDAKDAEAQIHKKLKSLSSSLTHVFQSDMIIWDNYEKMLLKKAMLSALPLRDLVREEGDEAIRAYERGCVLRVDQDAVVTPRGIPLPVLRAQYFRDSSGAPLDSGRFDLEAESPTDTTYLCAFQRIVDDYYYLDYTLSEVRDEYINAYLDTEGILKNLERAFNGHILLFSSSDDRHELLYTPEAFGDFATIEDTGIDPNTPAQSFAVVTLNDVEYIYTLSEPVKASDDSVDHTIRAAFLIPIENLTFRQIPRLAAALGISALFFIAAITWVRAVSSLIRRRIITEIQRREYGVTRVRKIIAIIGIIGALAVILMTTFVDALLLLYSTTQHNQALLETMNVVVSQSDQDEALVKAQLEDAYIRYAQRVADLLAANPELCNQTALQEICDVIGADYLMLFDDKGHETLSNAPYVNLTFSGASAASTYDFRRLLTGVPSIVHEPKVDEATGLNRQLIGVCMHDDNTADGYGALILARIPGDDVNAMSVDELMHSMTTEDCLCLILDPDSGDILHASDPDYVDENALTLGMPRRALQDNFMDYFRFDGVRWYSCSGLFDDGLYHCASMSSVIYSHLLRNALVFGGLFLVTYALLAVVLLFDFTDRLIDEYGGKVMDDEESLLHAKDSARDNASERLSLALKELHMIHKRTSPEKQTGFVFRLAGGIILISSLVFLLFRINSQVGTMNPSYILTYVMGDGWERGINLFAFARILLMLASIAAILMVLDLITSLLCHMLERRGETICRLITSLINYACMLGMLFASFNFLGFDTNALLASVGVLSLAVSLGARDLVADVLSGISIAIVDEYQIGDFIEVNGFRGWVLEIGVRSTTLVNNDGHIKNMSNRDVKNVLNLSRRNCRYSINITVGYDQSLQKVEEVLNRELPKIGEGIEEILNGPTYHGVTNIGNGGMTLTIIAECKEHNYGRVRSRLNREIRLMLEENGIAIK